MTSDHDVERRVQDWLEAEARPMPHHVLEGALEAIPRTSQVGTRRIGPAWLRYRSVALLAGAALVVLIVAAGALTVDRLRHLWDGTGAVPSEPRVWDPVADWLSAPNQENPSRDSFGNPRVWRYMYSTSSSHDPTRYLLMPNFEGEEAWKQRGMDGTPSFLGEAWNEPALINAFVGLGAAEAGDAAIYLHPGAYAVLGWTSPVAGEVTIDGGVARPQDPCSEPSGDLLFSVDAGSQTLRTIGLDNGQRSDFSVSTTVGIGDTVYFVVDADGDAICDLTYLQVTITYK